MIHFERRWDLFKIFWTKKGINKRYVLCLLKEIFWYLLEPSLHPVWHTTTTSVENNTTPSLLYPTSPPYPCMLSRERVPPSPREWHRWRVVFCSCSTDIHDPDQSCSERFSLKRCSGRQWLMADSQRQCFLGDSVGRLCVSVVYYESLKRELKTRPICEFRYDERLKTKVE